TAPQESAPAKVAGGAVRSLVAQTTTLPSSVPTATLPPKAHTATGGEAPSPVKGVFVPVERSRTRGSGVMSEATYSRSLLAGSKASAVSALSLPERNSCGGAVTPHVRMICSRPPPALGPIPAAANPGFAGSPPAAAAATFTSSLAFVAEAVNGPRQSLTIG